MPGKRTLPSIALLLCVILFLNVSRASAEKLPMDFIPMYGTERKELELEWNPAWFSLPPSEYNHELARLCCYLSFAAYSLDGDGIPADLIESYRRLGAQKGSVSFHYGLNYDNALGNDQCAFSLATVPLPDGIPLVILTVRGTPAGDNEWLSNLNIANSKEDSGRKKGEGGEAYHEGFLNAEQIVLRNLLGYTEARGLSGKGVRLLVTGHSRGAAVANIIGSHIVLQGLFPPENCYVYTIASPNVTTMDASLTQGERFSFIWNIVNAEDVVPAVPFNKIGDWNYRKFGNVKVLANAWSAGRERFYGELLPKMNVRYRYLTGRDYQPAGSGNFIHVQLGRLLASVNPTVDSFYKGMFSMHKYLAKMVPAMFPDEEAKAEKEEKGPSIPDRILDRVDEGNDGLISRISETVNNLHQSESYLSFLMELDERDCFSDAPSVQVVIRGLPEAAVLDREGREITRIKEGQTKLFELHESAAACMLGLQAAALGFPTDDDFQIVLTDTALFPSPVTLTSEWYSAEGVLQRSEEETIYPCRSRVYRIRAGKPQMSRWGLESQVLAGEERKAARSRTGIWSGQKKRFSLAAELDSDLNLGLGASFGTQLAYALALYRMPLQERLFGTWELDAGVGHKERLWSSVYLEAEVMARGVFVPDSGLREEYEEETGRSGVFSLVPALRLSLAWQPLRKAQVFAYAMESLAIRDFNEAAFESHRVSLPPWNVDEKFSLVPSFGIGLRF